MSNENKKVNVYLYGPYVVNSIIVGEYDFYEDGTTFKCDPIGQTPVGSNILGIMTVGCTYPELKDNNEVDLLERYGRLSIPVVDNAALEYITNKYPTYESINEATREEINDLVDYSNSLVSGLLFHNMFYFEFTNDNDKTESVTGVLGSILSRAVISHFYNNDNVDDVKVTFITDIETLYNKELKTYYNKQVLDMYKGIKDNTDVLCLIKPIFTRYDDNKSILKKCLITFYKEDKKPICILMGFSRNNEDKTPDSKVSKITML